MFSHIFHYCVDFLFPHTGLRKEVETIAPETFLARAGRAERSPKGVYAPLRYRDPLVRSTVWALKYKRSTRAARLLAHALYDTLLEELADISLFSGNARVLLVPIPLAPARMRERGFNQSELLAEALHAFAENAHIRYEPSVLTRVKNTPSQTRARGRNARFENIRNAFGVSDPQKISGAVIILIDDVTTTGATLLEAERTLRAFGAEGVVCLAAAH